MYMLYGTLVRTVAVSGEHGGSLYAPLVPWDPVPQQPPSSHSSSSRRRSTDCGFVVWYSRNNNYCWCWCCYYPYEWYCYRYNNNNNAIYHHHYHHHRNSNDIGRGRRSHCPPKQQCQFRPVVVVVTDYYGHWIASSRVHESRGRGMVSRSAGGPVTVAAPQQQQQQQRRTSTTNGGRFTMVARITGPLRLLILFQCGDTISLCLVTRLRITIHRSYCRRNGSWQLPTTTTTTNGDYHHPFIDWK